MAYDNFLVDKRVVERNIKKGLVDPQALAQHIEALPDRESNCVHVSLEGGSQARGSDERVIDESAPDALDALDTDEDTDEADELDSADAAADEDDEDDDDDDDVSDDDDDEEAAGDEPDEGEDAADSEPETAV